MTPSTHARPFIGIALKIASTIVFTAMATLIKLVSDRYPVGELTFFRSFFALIPVFAWVGWRGEFPAVFHTPRIGGHLIRSIAGAIAMFCGFTALSLLPIADATAIGYASPLMTVIFAVVLLGEKVHVYRWSAVVVGLFGVLVILSDYVGPEATHTGSRNLVGALFAVAGAIIGALAATQVRSLVRFEARSDDRRLFLDLHRALLAGHASRSAGLGAGRPIDARLPGRGGICGGARPGASSPRATASATPR